MQGWLYGAARPVAARLERSRLNVWAMLNLERDSANMEHQVSHLSWRTRTIVLAALIALVALGLIVVVTGMVRPWLVFVDSTPRVVAPAAPVTERAGSAAAPDSAPASGGTGLSRMNVGGAVSVQVTPLNLTGDGDSLSFRVDLETHSVDLNYDLAQTAVLRDDRGEEFTAAAWKGPRGGHHISGSLKFENRASILRPGTRWIELELKGIAQVPSRKFRWVLS